MGTKKVTEWLTRAPTYVFLMVPFLVVIVLLIWFLLQTPNLALTKYGVLSVVIFATIFSRCFQPFEYGFEIFHFTTICFTLVYGLKIGLLFNILSSIVVMFQAMYIGGHFFNHSFTGPMIQCIETFVTTMLVGIIGHISRTFFISNLLYVSMGILVIAVCIDKYLLYRFVGLDLSRLYPSAMVLLLMNYNLFITFGPRFIEILQMVKAI